MNAFQNVKSNSQKGYNMKYYIQLRNNNNIYNWIETTWQLLFCEVFLHFVFKKNIIFFKKSIHLVCIWSLND